MLQPHSSGQWMIVSVSAQVLSHPATQQTGSASQTKSGHATSSNPGPAWALQQGPPGVGVGVCAEAVLGLMRPNARTTTASAYSAQADPLMRHMVRASLLSVPGQRPPPGQRHD